MFDEVFPVLATPDLPRALAFYRDLLGATITYQFPPTGDPDYIGLALGATHLGIGRQAEPYPLVNDRVTLRVYATLSCDEAVDLLRDAGIRVAQEPVDQPWGERMAIVFDPDGNRVIIASRARS